MNCQYHLAKHHLRHLLCDPTLGASLTTVRLYNEIVEISAATQLQNEVSSLFIDVCVKNVDDKRVVQLGQHIPLIFVACPNLAPLLVWQATQSKSLYRNVPQLGICMVTDQHTAKRAGSERLAKRYAVRLVDFGSCRLDPQNPTTESEGKRVRFPRQTLWSCGRDSRKRGTLPAEALSHANLQPSNRILRPIFREHNSAWTASWSRKELSFWLHVVTSGARQLADSCTHP
mmetsp:Transcript_2849/g.6463  ORF Transcript_2849/g.6463 Transcript_2849/m.6463 type:complete len:230 (-) Transcript_2849:65-754(-)